MKSDSLERLRKLKLKVLSLADDDPGLMDVVSRYGNELELVMIGLREPLGPDLEIRDDLLPSKYVEFRQWFRDHGAYTIHELIKDRDLIALVDVVKVGKRGTCVSVHLREAYKGDMGCLQSKILVPRSWLPDPWFVKGESVLLFASCISGKAIVSGELGRLPVRYVGAELWVYAFGQSPNFWSMLPTQVIGAEVATKWALVQPLLRNVFETRF